MPINYVSNMLGHSNISTTSRYLNINRRGLHLAMAKYEAHQADGKDEASPESVARPLHTDEGHAQAVGQRPAEKPTVQ
jgi:hypothetical protein